MSAALAAGTPGSRPGPGPVPVPAPARVKETILDNGLRVWAVRRAGAPVAELRLRIPFASTRPAHLPRADLLADSFLAGTGSRDAQQVAVHLQELGAQLDASVDADALYLSGSCLAGSLPRWLELLADLVTGNRYPARDVAGHRDRLVEQLRMARSQPATLAREAVASRLYGDHPYGRELPTAEQVGAVTAAALRRLHADRVVPDGAVLVVVSDLTPGRVLAAVGAAMGRWAPAARPLPPALPAPAEFHPGGLVLVDRPDAVQTNLRFTAPGPRREAPDYADLVVANMAFGGYFSSRLTANLREDKGYTYGSHSVVDHAQVATELTIDADVASEATGPAVRETLYELGRVVTAPLDPAEIDSARRYVLGSLALTVSSQAGLASTLVRLAGAGLDAGWLRSYPAALARVTPAGALAAARRWLAPARFAVIAVGDASRVGEELVALLGPTQ